MRGSNKPGHEMFEKEKMNYNWEDDLQAMQYHHLSNKMKTKGGDDSRQGEWVKVCLKNCTAKKKRKTLKIKVPCKEWSRPGDRRRKVVILIGRREIRATATTLWEGNVRRTNSKFLYSAAARHSGKLKESVLVKSMKIATTIILFSIHTMLLLPHKVLYKSSLNNPPGNHQRQKLLPKTGELGSKDGDLNKVILQVNG